MTGTQLGWLTACGCLAFCSPAALGHHGPTKVIDDLTYRIEHGERSAVLFVRRGDEYRALGELDDAAADYQSALKISEEFTPALYGLAHIHLQRRQLEEAASAAERGIQAARRADEAPPFHALLALVYEESDRCEDALHSWDRAISSTRPDVDWFLGQAQVLWKLNRPDAAEEALRKAVERNPSEVLKRAWYESLIRSGKLSEAEQHIEKGLAKAKWKSAWLLLRARLHDARGERTEASQDAVAALEEIEQRLSPDAPNPFLVAQKAQSLALLGRSDEAREQAELARAAGIAVWKLAGVEAIRLPSESEP